MVERKKQIEDMTKVLEQRCNRDCIPSCEECMAEVLYDAGYRKQTVGTWIKDEKSKFEHRYYCSVCNFYLFGAPTKYCEECGAKMEGVSNNG